MITRIWHGRTSMRNSGEYLDFLLNKGTEEYRQTPGNISVRVWKYPEGETCHFWTVTEWKDMESVIRFAGDEPEKARYYPYDQGMLLELEENVSHYDSFDVSNLRISEYIRQLKELYIGGSWQGEFFLDKLRFFDDISAFRQPLEGIHSAAEIVWHCIYWHEVAIHTLSGDNGYRNRTAKEMNFQDPGTLRSMGWEKLKSDLAKTEQRLIELLYEKQDSCLGNEYERNKTFRHLIEGVIQHDLYHLGQLGLVIAVLKNQGVTANRRKQMQE